GQQAETTSAGLTVDIDAPSRGLQVLQLDEFREFYWELQQKPLAGVCGDIRVSSSLQGSKGGAWRSRFTNGQWHGSLRFANYLGTASIAVRCTSTATEQRLFFEVVSAKLDHESEYRSMVQSIASECQQLLLELGAPTALPLTVNPAHQSRILL